MIMAKENDDSNQMETRDLIKHEEELKNICNKTTQPVSFWSMSQPASIATGINNGGSRYPSSIMVVNTDDTSSVFDKRPRLPFLIMFNNNDDDENRVQVSMPAVGAEALEKPTASEEIAANRVGQSLPVDVAAGNCPSTTQMASTTVQSSTIYEVSEQQAEQMEVNSGSDNANEMPPQIIATESSIDSNATDSTLNGRETVPTRSYPLCPDAVTTHTTNSINGNQTYSSIGDSLIDLIIKLREENQVLAQAIDGNNRYVKERLVEAKEIHELAQSNERQFAIERREYQAQITKLQRQNTFLSDRLKNVEAQKQAQQTSSSSEQTGGASGSGTDSGDALLSAAMDRIYPVLDHHDSFSNAYIRSAATSSNVSASSNAEDYGLDTIQECSQLTNHHDNMMTIDYDRHRVQATAPPMSVSSYNQQHLIRHQTPQSTQTTLMEDPMKQCDKLEQRLNDIGKKDCEITILQNRLNLYRRDYGFEPIEKLEAQLQIEKLRNDIDRLCLERLHQQQQQQQAHSNDNNKSVSSGSGGSSKNNGQNGSNSSESSNSDNENGTQVSSRHGRHHKKAHKLRRHHRRHHHEETETSTSIGALSKLGNHLGKKALHQAAKAAKKAQIHAAKMESEQQSQAAMKDQLHYSSRKRSNPGSDMVNGLFSTANKAVLTGYKIASNAASSRVNSALERLNQQCDQSVSNRN